MTDRVRAESGAILVEFLIVFMPTLMLLLGGLQLSLIAAARLIVQHAAARGVRSASLILDDDPRYYDDAARGVLCNPEPERCRRDGPRLAAIRDSVHLPLVAIAPGPRQLSTVLAGQRGSAADALSDTLARLHHAHSTLPTLTAITFPISPGSALEHDATVPLARSVTVRVHFAFACVVPLASALICDIVRELPAAPGRDPALDELLGHGVRARLLQAEATLPIQSAPYPYQSEQVSR